MRIDWPAGEPMRCSKCGSENPAGKKFCGDYAAILSASGALPRLPASSGSAPEIPITAEWIGAPTTVDELTDRTRQHRTVDLAFPWFGHRANIPSSPEVFKPEAVA
jgi:hypothetical protein